MESPLGYIGGILLAIYYIGLIAAFLFVFPWRIGANPTIYVTAFAHPPSRVNGIVWAVTCFLKSYIWPFLLWRWLAAGRPPPTVLFGEPAAEMLGIPYHDTYSSRGFAIKWLARKDPRRSSPTMPPTPTVRRRQFPPTEYGYRPPQEAVVRSWRCGNEECGAMDYEEDPSLWPRSCPECKSEVFSNSMDEPWAHEAARYEIDHHLAGSGTGGSKVFWEDRDEIWRYEDAFMEGNLELASTIRIEADRRRREQVAAGGSGMSNRLPMVLTAIRHRALDDAVAEIDDWFSRIETADIESEGEGRIGARQLAQAVIEFFRDSDRVDHPASDRLHARLAWLMYRIRSHTSGDLETGFRLLSNLKMGERGLSVPPIAGIGIDLTNCSPKDRLREYGIIDFAGIDNSGSSITDSYNLIEPLLDGFYGSEEGQKAVARRVADLADHGGWVAIGAWRFMLSFCPDDPARERVMVAALEAIESLGVENLGLYLSPLEIDGYRRRFGRSPNNKPFFGPPVFSDPADGPTRKDYFESAARATAQRQPKRVRHAPGVRVRIEKPVLHCLHDLGRLVIQGPMVVPAALREEPAVVSIAADKADGTDHELFLAELAHILDETPRTERSTWLMIGAGRFIEDYLDGSLTGCQAHESIVDQALLDMRQAKTIPLHASTSCLSTYERLRARQLGPIVTR